MDVARAVREDLGRADPNDHLRLGKLREQRIVVCDAYHAMTSDRPYRGRLETTVAVERLRKAAGTQFDPHVVDAFVRLYDRRAVGEPD